MHIVSRNYQSKLSLVKSAPKRGIQTKLPNQETQIFVCAQTNEELFPKKSPASFFRRSCTFIIIPHTYLWTGPGRATVGIVPLTDRAEGGGMLPLVTVRPKYTAR